MEFIRGEILSGIRMRLAWMQEYVRRHGHGTLQRCIVRATSQKLAPPFDGLGGPFTATQGVQHRGGWGGV